MGDAVLVISGHPDDETLGCGGTLLRHHARGDRVFWLIVTKTYAPQWSHEVVAVKAAEVEAVATVYGFERHFNLGLPSARLDTVPEADLISGIRDVIGLTEPTTVYVVHSGDAHTDHQRVHRATMSVLKSFYMTKFGVGRILAYETVSSTDVATPHVTTAFLPNVFIDITPYIDRKLEIMERYRSEAQVEPLPRSASAIRALARYRGAIVGVQYAEAFMLIREVTR